MREPDSGLLQAKADDRDVGLQILLIDLDLLLVVTVKLRAARIVVAAISRFHAISDVRPADDLERLRRPLMDLVDVALPLGAIDVRDLLLKDQSDAAVVPDGMEVVVAGPGLLDVVPAPGSPKATVRAALASSYFSP